MTTKDIIEGVTTWVQDNICTKIELKLPDDSANDNRYSVKMVAPAAFPLFVPAKDRIPPNVKAPIPSVAVQLLEGSDLLKKGERRLKLRLCLSTWNPGTHPGETLHPVEDPDTLTGYRYETDPQGETYSRNSDGWKEEPIAYGPFSEDGVIWDYYPYWCGWISFSVVCGVPYKKSEAIRDLLN